MQDNIIFENICFENEIPVFIHSRTPVNGIKIVNSVVDSSCIHFENINTAGIEYPKTSLIFNGTTFKGKISNLVKCDNGLKASLKVYGSITDDDFKTKVTGDVEIIQADINIEK